VLACLLGYFAFNGGSLSVVTWLYCAEIFPLACGKRHGFVLVCAVGGQLPRHPAVYFTADALGIGLVLARWPRSTRSPGFVGRYAPETRGERWRISNRACLTGSSTRNAASSGVLLNKINSD
jgi:hypothetical protein